MSIPDNRKIEFLNKIGGAERIKNYSELINYFDKIYKINNWDESTITRVKNIMNEDIGEALHVLFYDHESWNYINKLEQ